MTELLQTCYNINTDDDDTGIHPSHVCYGCACRMRRIDKARDIAFQNPQSLLFQWSPHRESNCDICGHFTSTSVSGRKKERKNRGRPVGETPAQTLKALTEVAGKAVVSGVLPSQLLGAQVQEKNIICCACKCIVDAPAQLTCDNLACTQCIHQQFVAHGQQAECPGCCSDTVYTVHVYMCMLCTSYRYQHRQLFSLVSRKRQLHPSCTCWRIT